LASICSFVGGVHGGSDSGGLHAQEFEDQGVSMMFYIMYMLFQIAIVIFVVGHFFITYLRLHIFIFLIENMILN
jgi:hypothetical protein